MSLERRYDHHEAEARLLGRWAELKIYEFDPARPGPIYSVDTPPPTVSGQIHIGHVYSYTQADIAARYHRMRGRQPFYPFGFDDNGLPTERFAERTYGITARGAGREAFIRACLELSAQVEDRFERFWRRLGLSVDWRLRYSTIDDRCRRIAQRGFLDLYGRGQVVRRRAPSLWCPTCGTAVAQADVEDRDGVPTTFTTITFPTVDGRRIPIATTRPELLPACVAVFVHPDDPRYAELVGTTAIVPLFDLRVLVLANPEAQPEKGSGAVMCCTFGDVADVRWWATYALPLREALGSDGHLTAIAGPFAGLPVAEARARILETLDGQGSIEAQWPIAHTVAVHERCGTAIEYLVTSQWFVTVLEHRERLLKAGRAVAWHPAHMRVRYEHWVRGLAWDWNISRQRAYGVPFPLWYCEGCGEVALARPEQLPIDPATARPDAPCVACGGAAFAPEADVLDTWATSSLTPEILASLAADLGMGEAEWDARCAPLSVRPNAHDIIRTWDFYTIVQSLLHHDRIPWRAVMIAGHALNLEGEKISKSKHIDAAASAVGEAKKPAPGSNPAATIEQYSADAVRYWTAGTRMGGDTPVSEEAFRQGGRLVTKLWNAARFVLLHTATGQGPAPGPEARPALLPSDRWLLARLGQTVARATAALEDYEPSAARAAIERFFWSDFCDTYLELVKFRLLGRGADLAGAADGDGVPDARGAAAWTLHQALRTLLALLAPFLPFVTDEIYLQGFAGAEGGISIHLAAWPDSARWPLDEEALATGEAMLSIVEEVRRWKAARALSVGAPIGDLSIVCPTALVPPLQAMVRDLASITRAERIAIASGDELAVRVGLPGSPPIPGDA